MSSPLILSACSLLTSRRYATIILPALTISCLSLCSLANNFKQHGMTIMHFVQGNQQFKDNITCSEPYARKHIMAAKHTTDRILIISPYDLPAPASAILGLPHNLTLNVSHTQLPDIEEIHAIVEQEHTNAVVIMHHNLNNKLMVACQTFHANQQVGLHNNIQRSTYDAARRFSSVSCDNHDFIELFKDEHIRMQHILIKQHLESSLTSGSLLQLYSLYFSDETGNIKLIDTDEIVPFRAAASLSTQPQAADPPPIEAQERNLPIENAMQNHTKDQDTTFHASQNNRFKID